MFLQDLFVYWMNSNNLFLTSNLKFFGGRALPENIEIKEKSKLQMQLESLK